MLTAVALVVLAAGAGLAVAALGRLVDGLDQRRLRRVAAQIRVTDAVFASLGPIVAPEVSGSPRTHWTVHMSLEPRAFRAAGSLARIATQVLGQGRGGVRVVFRPPGPSR
jgi:hypothetical protein